MLRRPSAARTGTLIAELFLLGALPTLAKCQDRLAAIKARADLLRDVVAQIDKQRHLLIRRQADLLKKRDEAQKQRQLAAATYIKLAREAAALQQVGRAVEAEGVQVQRQLDKVSIGVFKDPLLQAQYEGQLANLRAEYRQLQLAYRAKAAEAGRTKAIGRRLGNDIAGINLALGALNLEASALRREFLRVIDFEGKLRREETEAAIEAVTQWATRDAQNECAFATRAMLYAYLGMFNEAIEDYKRVLALDWGRGVTAHVTRSYILMHQGKSKDAVADLNIAVRLSPRDAQIRRYRGVACMNSGNYEQARTDFLKALQYEPKSPWSHVHLAEYYAACPSKSRRNADKAQEHGTTAVQLTGGANWRCLDALAMAYAESGMFDLAIATAQKAIAAAPDRNKQACKGRLSLYQAGMPFRFSR